MLNDGKIKIGDFGFGRIIEGDMNEAVKMSRKCTPLYGSPQILFGQAYSSKADIWSIGIILYEMIYGNWPFYGKSEPILVQEIVKRVQDKKLALPTVPKVSDHTADIIQRMLMYNEEGRISWDEIIKHPILSESV